MSVMIRTVTTMRRASKRSTLPDKRLLGFVVVNVRDIRRAYEIIRGVLAGLDEVDCQRRIEAGLSHGLTKRVAGGDGVGDRNEAITDRPIADGDVQGGNDADATVKQGPDGAGDADNFDL